jgi:hypothetical protein
MGAFQLIAATEIIRVRAAAIRGDRGKLGAGKLPRDTGAFFAAGSVFGRSAGLPDTRRGMERGNRPWAPKRNARRDRETRGGGDALSFFRFTVAAFLR